MHTGLFETTYLRYTFIKLNYLLDCSSTNKSMGFQPILVQIYMLCISDE